MNRQLIDTCIFIDYLRGKQTAIDYLEGLNNQPFVSALTIGELYAGVREGEEKTLLDTLTNSLEVIPLTTEIAKTGGLFRRDYGKTHGLDLVDALLIATAQIHQLTLVTINSKHFSMFENVYTPY